MKKNLLADLRGVLVLIPFVLYIAGCKNDNPPSLFDPNQDLGTAPVISNISPAGSALAGVDIVTITGSNFSPAKENNTVWFDAATAEVLEASSTQLKVRAPVVIKDSIKVKVAVFKVELFSNTMFYKLEAAVSELYAFKSFEEPWGIACDTDGNVYVSMVINNSGAGVKKITPAGVLSDYAPKGTELKYSALKVGPNGVIYAARIQRVIFQIPAAGSAPVVFASTGLGTIYDFDFDANKNIWAAGNNTSIYRVKPDKSIMAFPFTANVRSVRVFRDGDKDYVYLAGNRDGFEKVWRLEIISSDQVGPEEEYFDFSQVTGGPNGPGIYAITFAADGSMYLGTDATEAIFVVNPDKTYAPLYPGLFSPKTLLFAWGKDTELYLMREKSAGLSQTIIKLNARKAGAPYYGRE